MHIPFCVDPTISQVIRYSNASVQSTRPELPGAPDQLYWQALLAEKVLCLSLDVYERMLSPYIQLQEVDNRSLDVSYAPLEYSKRAFEKY